MFLIWQVGRLLAGRLIRPSGEMLNRIGILLLPTFAGEAHVVEFVGKDNTAGQDLGQR